MEGQLRPGNGEGFGGRSATGGVQSKPGQGKRGRPGQRSQSRGTGAEQRARGRRQASADELLSSDSDVDEYIRPAAEVACLQQLLSACP